MAFIVPVRNDAARLARCLASIRATSAADTAVIVMDHGSCDGSAEIARAAGARVIAAPATVSSVATLRNAGVAATPATLVAFVDADHEVVRDWLSSALSAVQDQPVGAVGASYHAPAGGTWVQVLYDGLRRHPPDVEPAEWIGAGNLLVRREAFDAVGGFDETLESCEDVDLCFRLRQAGWRLLNVPAMYSTHHGDPATLAGLFRSELWRGRDNVRVSLRERPLSVRNVVSLLIPVVELGAVAAVVTGVLVGSTPGSRLALGAAMLVASLIVLRARLVLQAIGSDFRCAVPRALAVAATYDAGRALALVVRAGHHRRAPARPVA